MIVALNYKNEYFMVELMDANPKLLDYTIFPANILVVCPDIELEDIQILPPWKE